MRLIETRPLITYGDKIRMVYFMEPPKRYAILSHTWSTGEVEFADVKNAPFDRGYPYQGKQGYSKIFQAAAQARKHGHEYIWVDTCCIDKSSSAELSEAINSMFQWYRRATVCYVFLEDVRVASDDPTFDEQFLHAKWHTRGWTLQELLAPIEPVHFFNANWHFLGKSSNYSAPTAEKIPLLLVKATSIESNFLNKNSPISWVSIAQRMRWASSRQTSRAEDIAYCLLGIFDVNMPLLYGEGAIKAFLRLQDEIMKQSDEHSIFTWVDDDPLGLYQNPTGLLALQPSCFSGHYYVPTNPRVWSDTDPYHLTSRGIQIRLPLESLGRNIYLATLDCLDRSRTIRVAIYLRRLQARKNLFSRLFADRLVFQKMGDVLHRQSEPQSILVGSQKSHNHDELDPGSYILDVDAQTAADHRLLAICSRSLLTPANSWNDLSKVALDERDIHAESCLVLIQHVQSREELAITISSRVESTIGFAAAYLEHTNVERPGQTHDYVELLSKYASALPTYRNVVGSIITTKLKTQKCRIRLRPKLDTPIELAPHGLPVYRSRLELNIKTIPRSHRFRTWGNDLPYQITDHYPIPEENPDSDEEAADTAVRRVNRAGG